jgi:hypothetical protein
MEKAMRKFALLSASAAGALFTIAVMVPNRADAMAFSNPAGVLDAVSTADDLTTPTEVRYCRWRGCSTRFYGPPPSYWSWGWYRPWPYYYPYSNLGTGQSNFGFAR